MMSAISCAVKHRPVGAEGRCLTTRRATCRQPRLGGEPLAGRAMASRRKDQLPPTIRRSDACSSRKLPVWQLKLYLCTLFASSASAGASPIPCGLLPRVLTTSPRRHPVRRSTRAHNRIPTPSSRGWQRSPMSTVGGVSTSPRASVSACHRPGRVPGSTSTATRAGSGCAVCAVLPRCRTGRGQSPGCSMGRTVSVPFFSLAAALGPSRSSLIASSVASPSASIALIPRSSTGATAGPAVFGGLSPRTPGEGGCGVVSCVEVGARAREACRAWRPKCTSDVSVRHWSETAASSGAVGASLLMVVPAAQLHDRFIYSGR